MVGLQAVIGLVVVSQFSFSPEHAALNALWALCGGAIQIVLMAVVWPTWERTRVADRLADLVEIDGRYGAALLHAWADPASADRAALQRLRRAARLARSNPPLRATQVAVAAHLRNASTRAAADPTPTAVDMVVLSESDLRVNAVDTLAHLVGVGPRSPVES